MIDADATELGVDEKRDLIERLGIIGGPWAKAVLRAANAQERGPELRDAIAAALRDIGGLGG